MGMFDGFMEALKSTGGGYTPGNQQKIAGIDSAYNAGKIDENEAVAQKAMVEKGSILGLTPSSFASAAGQLGAAISPKDSWQAKLGGMAAQFGSNKMQQLVQAEKEKRSTDLLKQILSQTTPKQLGSMPGLPSSSVGMGIGTGVGGAITGIKKGE